MCLQVVADHPVVVQEGVAEREDVDVDGGAVRWAAGEVFAAGYAALAVVVVCEAAEDIDSARHKSLTDSAVNVNDRLSTEGSASETRSWNASAIATIMPWQAPASSQQA